MFAAYTAGGAPAQLKIRPNGSDGVVFLSADLWFASVEPFLEGLGLPTVPIVSPPLFAELPTPPGATAVCKKAFVQYLAMPDDSKAFAVSSGGGCGTGFGRTSVEAREPALTNCKIGTRGGDCKLYAVGQRLVGD